MKGILMVRETGVPIGEALLDVVIGFVLVLAVMILLIVIFWAFGKVMSSLSGREKKVSDTPAVPKPVKPSAINSPMSKAATADADDEVVAVIAAAVAAMAPAGKTYAVRRIRCQSSGRPAWAAAGAFENTRPF